ncbi:MAG: DUF3226 domain-containing protein [Candidatus Binatia bacterium]
MAVGITKPNVLVVEGREEELFFGAFTEYLALQNIQIMGIGGKTNLQPNLKALTLSPRFTEVISLGLVRDANADPHAAFQSVCGALQSVELPTPERPLVSAGDSPRVTVMILPEEAAPGMLEDLCLSALVQDPAMTCVEQYFQCLQQQGSILQNPSKAKVQAFLASRREAGKRLGEAAQAGYLPWDHKAFDRVRAFLRQVAS